MSQAANSAEVLRVYYDSDIACSVKLKMFLTFLCVAAILSEKLKNLYRLSGYYSQLTD